MAIVTRQYQLSVITDEELKRLAGSGVRVQGKGAVTPTITIEYDDREKDGIVETIDEIMLTKGYTPV